MTQGCLFMSSGPIPLLTLISLFLQLLSAYYATVVLLGMLIFFLLTLYLIILLLEVPSYFISWNIQVSMIFLYITSKCWGTENFLWFELDCRNVSGSLGKQEVLWEQEVVGDCFDNFFAFSQTCTSYRNKTSRSCSLFIISWVSFLPDYRIYSPFGTHNLSVSQVSVKQNIQQRKNWIKKFFLLPIMTIKARKLCNF